MEEVAQNTSYVLGSGTNSGCGALGEKDGKKRCACAHKYTNFSTKRLLGTPPPNFQPNFLRFLFFLNIFCSCSIPYSIHVSIESHTV